MEVTTLLMAGILFLIAYFWFKRLDPRLPPSPMRPLPVVGHLPYLTRDFRKQFVEFREKCGDIFSLNFGGTLVVVLNGYDLIKEALVKKADVFSDRPPMFLDELTGFPKKGVIFSSGTVWKEQRSITLSILRAFGMGKNLLAEKIQDEVGCYLNYLAGLKGNRMNIRAITTISFSNVICSILIGQRFDYEDKDFQDLLHKLDFLSTGAANASIVNFISWLHKLPGDLFKTKKLKRCIKAIIDLLSKFIEQKRRHTGDTDEVCNLIDAYLKERHKKNQAGIPTTMDDENLVKIMFDLFVAGTETTSTTIYWCILYMLNYPKVQEKVYQEIKEQIGTDRTPTIHDKTQLTYLNAVITETQRLSSLVPTAVTHMVSEEVTLGGYTLPKGTLIFPSLDSVLFDKTTWGEDAMSFRPERFIDNNGKLKIPEQFIPFSIGRRVCLGEAIAKMELFLFLSSMFQKFQFLPATPGTVPPLLYDIGGVVVPKQYEVIIVERN